jgi:magnesium-transporting ATPase (P-type)
MSTKKKERISLESSTYLLLLLYTFIFTVSVYFILTDETFNLTLERRVLHQTGANLKGISPALKAARNVVKDKLKNTFSSPKYLFALISVIFLMTFVFGYLLNIVIEKVLLKQKKKDSKRVIARIGDKFFCDDVTSNAIRSTAVEQQSVIQFVTMSLVYGAVIYLAQKIQMWCIAIAFVQLCVFQSTKSFWPLLVFTIFMAVSTTFSEWRKRKNDYKKNSRNVTLVHIQNDEYTEETVQRCSLKSGDIVKINANEAIPADVLILDTRVDGKKTIDKLIFHTNEVQVTGESAPVRKYCYTEPVENITIAEISEHKALINSQHVEISKHFAYGDSILESKTENLSVYGVVCWVGSETKALRNPIAESGSTLRQPSPFDDFTSRGFVLSVVVMLVIATINAIAAVFYHQEESQSISFVVIWVNHVMYLNMLVPQAMEQMRLVTSSLLGSRFDHSKVNCNVSNSIDVFGQATRIVSDKTGTLTKNQMIAKMCMIFPDAAVQSDPFIIDDNTVPLDSNDTSTLEEHLMTVFSITEDEPEEKAIRERVSAIAQRQHYHPLDTGDTQPGSVTFTTTTDNVTQELTILASFGFIRDLRCKAVLFYDIRSDRYYIGIQSGSDEFWRSVDNTTTSKLLSWDSCPQVIHLHQHSNGAPRIWSHGIKPIEDTTQIAKLWVEYSREADSTIRVQKQVKLVESCVHDCKLISRTFMIDAYRDNVPEGIKQLVAAGKQIIMCTGDSLDAAQRIAQQLGFPGNAIIFKSQDANTPLTENQLYDSLKLAKRNHASEPSTFYVDEECLLLLQKIEETDEDLRCFDLLLPLLEAKSNGIYIHSAVFCRATPDLKPYVIKLMQRRYTKTPLKSLFAKRHYVIAIGDGINDVNMLRQADASMAVKSGETDDVCDVASVWHDEWDPLTNLLLKDGPAKTIMLGTMIKMVFLKHWTTAFALFIDFLYMGCPLLPMEPCDPMLMMLYNAVTFSHIASHSASDKVDDTDVHKKNSFSPKTLIRWGVTALLIGGSTCWIARALQQNLSLQEFGGLLQASQACAMTVVMFLLTNSWSARENLQKASRMFRNTKCYGTVIGAVGSIILSIFASIYALQYYAHADVSTKAFVIFCIVGTVAGYPGLKLLRVLDRDYRKIMRDTMWLYRLLRHDTGQFISIVIEWGHTKHGRCITTLLFLIVVKLFTDVSFIAIMVIGLLVSVVSLIVFTLITLSKISFMRALFNGKPQAMFVTGVVVGVALKSLSLPAIVPPTVPVNM